MTSVELVIWGLIAFIVVVALTQAWRANSSNLSGKRVFDVYTAALDRFKMPWQALRRNASPPATRAEEAAPLPPAVEAASAETASGESAVLVATPVSAEAASLLFPESTATVEAASPVPIIPRVAHVQIAVDLPEGSTLRVTVESVPGQESPIVHHVITPGVSSLPTTPALPQPKGVRAGGLQAGSLRPRIAAVDWRARVAEWQARLGLGSRALSLEMVLFGLGLAVYLFTRLWAIDQFPIYFFADEATNSLFAEDLINRGFRDAKGVWFPMYFDAAANRWTPLLSVYVHAFTVGLFGKSIIVARTTSALVSVLAAVAISLLLKRVFKSRFWGLGAMLLAVTPAWFLHSRTAFETVMMVSFYGAFLLFYFLYRTEDLRYIYPALIFGAATFYTYSNGQLVMAVAALLLLISDARFHWRQRRALLRPLGLAGLLALPLIFFLLSHPSSTQTHLRAVDSIIYHSIPLSEKILYVVRTYLYGLSPQYWFFYNDHDLRRHVMAGYGHLRTEMLPLVLIGLGMCLWRFRSSPHRGILLAALAAPIGASLVNISITRVLAFIIPATVLAGLGLEVILNWLTRRMAFALAATATFGLLAFISLFTLRQALTEGPLWFRDYGLYGMQYGAKQLFVDAIPKYLRQSPNIRIGVSPTWANGADAFVRFFLAPEDRNRVQMLNVNSFLDNKGNLNPDLLLVMTPQEYNKALSSPKFKTVDIDQIIPYPDGNPGFYFARLTYAENVDAIFAAEQEARHTLLEGSAVIDGQTVQVKYSQIDGGQPKDMFDGDLFTLMRGLEANPYILELAFPQSRPITSLAADFGSMDFTITVNLYGPGSADPVAYTETYTKLPPDPHVELHFGKGPSSVSKVRIEILNTTTGPTAKIHIRELVFR
jgi:4-amino-4-deoxy-L-arabinose transferase-like glycosyltransferase